MFGRGMLFIAVLLAAVAIPFFFANDDAVPGRRLTGWWNSMVQDGDRQPGFGSPIPSTSPLPSRRRTGEPVKPWSTARLPRNSSPLTTKFGPTDPSTTTLPPRATATPWMPVDGTSGYASSSAVPGYAQDPRYGQGGENGQGGAAAAPGADANRIGPYVQHVGELFRFDITPEWVVHHWPRVSSQLAEFSYTGLRVPVVTGTKMHDLAGSITYYFDDQRQLQRIMFLGKTGDPTPLVQFATAYYKMQPEAALNGSCYVARSKKLITDMLRVRHAAIAQDARPHQRYEVAMEVNRADSPQGLSALSAGALEHERKIMEINRAKAARP